MVFVDDDYVLRSILSYLGAKSLQQASGVSRRLRQAVVETCSGILAQIKESGCVLLDDDGYGAYSHSIIKADDQDTTSAISSIQRLHEITKQKIFLIGGGSFDEGADSYKRCDSSDDLLHSSSGGSWSRLKGMSTKRGSFSTEAIVYRGLVMVFSGDDRASCGTNELYDPLAEQWLHLPELPSRIMYGSACVGPKGKVLYSGGMDNETGEYSNRIYMMNLTSESNGGGDDDDVITNCSASASRIFRWTLAEGSPLIQARYGHASACLGENVYVAGGFFTDNEGGCLYINTVEVYNASNGVVRSVSPMISARIFFKLVVLNDSLFAIGGNVSQKGAQEEGSIERYDHASDTWSEVTKYVRTRRVHSVTTVDNKILLIGGRDEDYSNLNDFDTFDVDTCLWNDGTSTNSVGIVKDYTCDGGTLRREGSSGSLSRFLNRTMVGGAAVTLNSKRMTWS